MPLERIAGFRPTRPILGAPRMAAKGASAAAIITGTEGPQWVASRRPAHLRWMAHLLVASGHSVRVNLMAERGGLPTFANLVPNGSHAPKAVTCIALVFGAYRTWERPPHLALKLSTAKLHRPATLLLRLLVGWPVRISADMSIFAVLFAADIGIFFGWYRAHKATRLEPIEALRFERVTPD